MTIDATQQLGELLRQGDRVGLRFVRTLRHEPAKVWRALTEADQLAHWMPAYLDGPLGPGAQVTAVFWPDLVARYGIEQAALPAEILVWDPPRVLEWRWDTDLLRFELAPLEDGGTELTLVTWIARSGPPPYQVGAGYHLCLSHLVELDTTGAAPSVAAADASPYEARYAEAWGTSWDLP